MFMVALISRLSFRTDDHDRDVSIVLQAKPQWRNLSLSYFSVSNSSMLMVEVLYFKCSVHRCNYSSLFVPAKREKNLVTRKTRPNDVQSGGLTNSSSRCAWCAVFTNSEYLLFDDSTRPPIRFAVPSLGYLPDIHSASCGNRSVIPSFAGSKNTVAVTFKQLRLTTKPHK